jgi:lysophospholipid acyltransferase (LPLAT)-like uncharacterized protein
VAIAVLPDGPRGRRDRLASALLLLAVVLVLGLLVFSLLDAYVS